MWRLSTTRGRKGTPESVGVQGTLTSNDGEIAVNWALEGHGVLMRAEWDIEQHLRSGRLVQVLPQFHTPDADIYVVYPQKFQRSARVRAFIEMLAVTFAQRAPSKK